MAKIKLRDLMEKQENARMGTEHGLAMHTRLQRVDLSHQNDITERILENPELAKFFDGLSKPEVAVAGHINGKFVSCRIDRLRIDDATKTINILDFKTDSDKESRRDHYKEQLGKYKTLLSDIYPGYKILCHILWLHDWTLEQII